MSKGLRDNRGTAAPKGQGCAGYLLVAGATHSRKCPAMASEQWRDGAFYCLPCLHKLRRAAEAIDAQRAKAKARAKDRARARAAGFGQCEMTTSGLFGRPRAQCRHPASKMAQGRKGETMQVCARHFDKLRRRANYWQDITALAEPQSQEASNGKEQTKAG